MIGYKEISIRKQDSNLQFVENKWENKENENKNNDEFKLKHTIYYYMTKLNDIIAKMQQQSG